MSIAFDRWEERAPAGGVCAGGRSVSAGNACRRGKSVRLWGERAPAGERKGLRSPAALWHNGIDSRGRGPAGKAGMEDGKQETAKCPEPKTEEYGESPEDGAEGA